MISRPLRLYEQICATMSVNFMLEFEALNVNKENLKAAYNLLKQKHPYYRMKIKVIDDKQHFVEESSEVDDFYCDIYELKDKNELNNWNSRLIKIGCQPRDHSKSLVYFELYSIGNYHQLFACINHAGIDGPGVFLTAKDLSAFLDSVLGNEIQTGIESRAFYDIHENYNHSYDIEEMKKEELIKDFLENLKPLENNPKAADSPFISSQFAQLDEIQTKLFVENCKKNNCTVQGALSSALMIALINEKMESLGEVIKCVNSCPCNMREIITPKLTNEDIVCGSAALNWYQEARPTDRLWELANKATQGIRAKLSENYGHKWWVRIVTGCPIQSYSMMSSSMGVLKFNELNNVKLIDLRFLGSNYALPAGAAGVMTHAFTFLGRFTYNISYTYPALNEEWSKNFADNVYKIISYYASREQENSATLDEIFKKLTKFKF